MSESSERQVVGARPVDRRQGDVVDPQDIEGTVSALQRLVDRHARQGSIPAALPPELRERLARRSRAAEFLKIFEDVAR